MAIHVKNGKSDDILKEIYIYSIVEEKEGFLMSICGGGTDYWYFVV